MTNFEITWYPSQGDGMFGGAYSVNSAAPSVVNLPTLIVADRYDTVRSDSGSTHIDFYTGDNVVASIYSLPMMIRATQAT